MVIICKTFRVKLTRIEGIWDQKISSEVVVVRSCKDRCQATFLSRLRVDKSIHHTSTTNVLPMSKPYVRSHHQRWRHACHLKHRNHALWCHHQSCYYIRMLSLKIYHVAGMRRDNGKEYRRAIITCKVTRYRERRTSSEYPVLIQRSRILGAIRVDSTS